MALTADQIGPAIAPALDQFFAVSWMIAQLVILIAIIYFAFVLFTFNVKVSVKDMTKGRKVVARTVKAKEFLDRKTNTPKLKFFGFMGFGGLVINQPPSECITPYKSMFAKKIYEFVKKDGIYYPIENYILGRKYQDENGEDVYSVEGSGLEISRDYDSEQAIQNNLIAKAETYRNSKPSVLYAMYGLAIILAIGSFVTMVYSWNQFGNVAAAISGLQQPLEDGVTKAVQQKLGP